MRIFHRTTVLLLLFALLAVSGCGRQKLPPGMPKLFKVTMTITQEDKPLAEAMVTLDQTDGQWSAQGTTDANGVIKKFYTNGQYEGVVAGKFKVCVRKIEREYAIDPKDIPPEPTDPQERYAWRMKYFEHRIPPKEFDLVESQYFDTKTTPLEIEVTADSRDFKFDVGAAVRNQYQR